MVPNYQDLVSESFFKCRALKAQNEIKIYDKTEVINTIQVQTMHDSINNCTSFSHVSLHTSQELSVNNNVEHFCILMGGAWVCIHTLGNRACRSNWNLGGFKPKYQKGKVVALSLSASVRDWLNSLWNHIRNRLTWKEVRLRFCFVLNLFVKQKHFQNYCHSTTELQLWAAEVRLQFFPQALSKSYKEDNFLLPEA